MDTRGYVGDKYEVERTDGKPVGRVVVIEIDKDPDAEIALIVLGAVYLGKRKKFAMDLLALSKDVSRATPATSYIGDESRAQAVALAEAEARKRRRVP